MPLTLTIGFQLTLSLLVIITFSPPATKILNSGDQQIENHRLLLQFTIAQSVPFLLVITLSVPKLVPEAETATNNSNSSDQQTEYH